MLPDCVILSDAWNHNSMIEGVQRSGVEEKIWRHNDGGHLEELLAAEPPERPKDQPVLEQILGLDMAEDLAGSAVSSWKPYAQKPSVTEQVLFLELQNAFDVVAGRWSDLGQNVHSTIVLLTPISTKVQEVVA